MMNPAANAGHVLKIQLYLSNRSPSTPSLSDTSSWSGSSGSEPVRREVLFDLYTHGERIAHLSAPADELGLPSNPLQKLQLSTKHKFKLPRYILTALESVLSPSALGGEPLWLQLGHPSGALPLVPWEHLLMPRLGLPIVRWSDLLASPSPPPILPERLEAAFCFSAPVAQTRMPAQEVISRFIQQIPHELARKAVLHLFADGTETAFLQHLRDTHRKTFKIEVYDPQLANYDVAENDRTDLENPWLAWMENALRGRQLHAVHFLGHGYLGRNLGALALAESPVRNVDPSWASIVVGRDLAIFLTRMKVWSVGLSSPPENLSIPGLRLLQHQLSHMHPGPILLHDMADESEPEALRNNYEFLFSRGSSAGSSPPASSSISLYCHPDWLPGGMDSVRQRDLMLTAESASLLIGQEQNVNPAVSAVHRILSRSADSLKQISTVDAEAAVKTGIERARHWISNQMINE